MSLLHNKIIAIGGYFSYICVSRTNREGSYFKNVTMVVNVNCHINLFIHKCGICKNINDYANAIY